MCNINIKIEDNYPLMFDNMDCDWREDAQELNRKYLDSLQDCVNLILSTLKEVEIPNDFKLKISVNDTIINFD